MKLCDYGCGELAIHKFKNGKRCCSESLSKCLVMRNKNSVGSKGKNKHRFYEIIPNENILCYYGCGNIAVYMAGQKKLKPCCSRYYSQCGVIVNKASSSNTGSIRPRGQKSKLFGRKRQDQSMFMKKNNPMFNGEIRKLHLEAVSSDEYKIKMSEIIKKRWESDEYRDKYFKSLLYKGIKYSDKKLRSIEIYYRKVKHFTNRSLVEHFDKINPNNYSIGIGDGFYNVDHIHSIADGFRNNVEPKIIGSHINLQTILSSDNIKKSCDSWITKEELLKRYEDVYNF